uniref:Uncharacterized protein n=1 Tax=Anguilla anguilla TaxID=7936 RepID=A0A0E9WGQ5_ANGAN
MATLHRTSKMHIENEYKRTLASSGLICRWLMKCDKAFHET